MRRSFIDPATLKAVAELISDIADSAVPAGCGCREFEEPCFFDEFEPCRCGCGQPFGVAGFPKEDPNKVFGVNVRVDQPVRQDFCTRWEFEEACRKYDRLVDAAEACDWENKSNTAPLHRVNCIRRPVHMGPPTGINLIGESRMW